jgi:hypothetical protein
MRCANGTPGPRGMVDALRLSTLQCDRREAGWWMRSDYPPGRPLDKTVLWIPARASIRERSAYDAVQP